MALRPTPKLRHFRCFVVLLLIFSIYDANGKATQTLNVNPMLYKLMDLFVARHCTIHFSIRAYLPWSQIHTQVLNYCDNNLSAPCILLQTNTLRKTEFSSDWHATMTTTSLRKWQQSSYENWRPVGWILAVQKFTPSCTLQLASPVALGGSSDNLLLFPETRYWNEINSYQYKHPDYILMRISQPEVNSFLLSTLIDLPSKLLVILDKPEELYLGCNSCHFASKNGQFFWGDKLSLNFNYGATCDRFRLHFMSCGMQFITLLSVPETEFHSLNQLDAV